VNTEALGGRKFILAMVCLAFLFLDFIFMGVRGWLTPDKCMVFLTYLPIILGLFGLGNAWDKKQQPQGGAKTPNGNI
jgi:hypothetical protein